MTAAAELNSLPPEIDDPAFVASRDSHNLPLPPAELERRLSQAPFTIAAAEEAGGGVMGARRFTIIFPDQRAIDVKWKTAPAGGDGWNNSPRREIGVFAVQKLFLDPVDYLIPPVVARAIDLTAFRAVDEGAVANIEGTHCVYGALAAWMIHVHRPEHAFDPKRFARDSRYAYHFGNLNLLHYLVKHRDARTSNFVMSDDENNPQLFSVDNGIAFGGTVFNFLCRNFNKLRVDRLPRKSVDRLRQLTRVDLDRLGVLDELHLDPSGILQPVARGANLDPGRGNRVGQGVIQIGLTVSEIDAIAARIDRLLNLVERGKIRAF